MNFTAQIIQVVYRKIDVSAFMWHRLIMATPTNITLLTNYYVDFPGKPTYAIVVRFSYSICRSLGVDLARSFAFL